MFGQSCNLKSCARFAIVPLSLVMGIIFIAHGSQKLFGWFGGHGLSGTAMFFQDKLGFAPGILWATLAGGSEFFGGLFLIIGIFCSLLRRIAGLLLAIVMMVAVFKVHLPNGLFASNGGYEYPLALLAAALFFILDDRQNGKKTDKN